MFEPAQRMLHFHTSVFMDLRALKEQYEIAHNQNTIDFSLGSPNIAPDPKIMESLARAVEDPANYQYAIKPLPALIQAIQKWYHTRYDVELESGEIALLQGSQEALVNLPLLYCNPTDGILVPDPYYPVYVDAPKLAGAQVIFTPLTKENDYLVDFSRITAAHRKQAKMIIVCYPNNPTGATAPDSFYEELIRFAKENDILVVHDNAYSELVFDGKRGKSFLSFPGAKEVGVELNSFSKTYGMAGARLGVLVGNESVINQYKMLKSNMDYGIFLPIQYAGVVALEQGGTTIESTRQAYQNRRDALVRGFQSAGWKIPLSQATMFLWAPIPDTYKDSVAFTKALLKETGIIVTPGESFGPEGRRFVRIALVQDEQAIEEAVRRLKQTEFFVTKK